MQTHSIISLIDLTTSHGRLALDEAIWQHRMHYGQERDGYRSLYWLTTVRDVQRFVRGERPYYPEAYAPASKDDPTREEAIVDLLDAHRDDPHALWTLLLIVAFEDELVLARLRLGALPDVRDDERVVAAFAASLESVSRFEGVAESVRRVEHGLAARVFAMVERRRAQRAIRRAARPRVPRVERDSTDRRSRAVTRKRWHPQPRRFSAEVRPQKQRAKRILARRRGSRRRTRRSS